MMTSSNGNIFRVIGPLWRHHDVIKVFSASLTICAGNSPVPGEFPTQRLVMRSFDVFCDLRLNKRLSKQSWGWWIETQSRPLCRHCNDFTKPFSGIGACYNSCLTQFNRHYFQPISTAAMEEHVPTLWCSDDLTHSGGVAHSCVRNPTTIVSNNGKHFHSRKCMWKCCVENGGHFVSAPICENTWADKNMQTTFEN